MADHCILDSSMYIITINSLALCGGATVPPALVREIQNELGLCFYIVFGVRAVLLWSYPIHQMSVADIFRLSCESINVASVANGDVSCYYNGMTRLLTGGHIWKWCINLCIAYHKQTKAEDTPTDKAETLGVPLPGCDVKASLITDVLLWECSHSMILPTIWGGA